MRILYMYTLRYAIYMSNNMCTYMVEKRHVMGNGYIYIYNNINIIILSIAVSALSVYFVSVSATSGWRNLSTRRGRTNCNTRTRIPVHGPLISRQRASFH